MENHSMAWMTMTCLQVFKRNLHYHHCPKIVVQVHCWKRTRPSNLCRKRLYCRVDDSYYYRLLEVEPNADWDTIKRAYRKKALECHPDVCKDPNAKEKFVRVLHAYQELSKQKHNKEGFRTTKTPNSAPSETDKDFMKEWRKKNPYPEDLNDDWASLWNDIVQGAKKAAKDWSPSTAQDTSTSSSFLEDIVSFIQDQLIGLSSKEQEEDFEAILRSGNPQLLRKEMEQRKALLQELEKKLEASEAVCKAKQGIVDYLQRIYGSYEERSHIQKELKKQLDLACSEKVLWDKRVANIRQQCQREANKIHRLKTRLDVDEELESLKRQMGME